MDIIANDLKYIFLEPAKATGMFTKCNINKNKRRRICNKPWFNIKCDTSKKDYKKFNKSLSKNPNDTEKAALKALANKHKQLLRKEKREFDKELNAKIRVLKSTDPGKYWSLINPRKKKNKCGDLSLDAVQTHFSDMNKNISNSSENQFETQNNIANNIINVDLSHMMKSRNT